MPQPPYHYSAVPSAPLYPDASAPYAAASYNAQNPQNYGRPPSYHSISPESNPNPPHFSSDPSQPHSHYESESRSQYRDQSWAIAFLIHLFLFVSYGAFCFSQLLHRIERDFNSSELTSSSSSSSSSSSDSFHFTRSVLFIFLALIGASFFLSFAFLAIFRLFAAQLIWATLSTGVIVPALLAIFLESQGAVGSALLLLLISLISALYAWSVRDRIPFSAALLASAAQSLEIYRNSIYLAFWGIFSQIVWAGIWILSVVAMWFRWNVKSSASGSIFSTSDSLDDVYVSDPSPLYSWLMFASLISFYWTSQVIKNIVHVSAAGVAATWYFLYPRQPVSSPVWNAFRRACTWSLGSISLGSLLVAVLRAVRSVVQSMIKKNSRRENFQPFAVCLLYIADCLLQTLDRLIEWFNHFAFAGIGIWGQDFRSASRDTWSLIKERGFDIIINENLTGGVLAMGGIIGGLAIAALAVILAYIGEYGASDQVLFMWGLFGFLIGFVLVSVALELVESSVTTLFICLASDPNALSQTKPEVYLQLVPALDARYHIKWASNNAYENAI